MSFYKYNSKNKNNARKNRRIKNMAEEERKLWYLYLRYTKEKFYRQFRLGNYILDFYCPSKKIAIELDGCQHYEDKAMEYDQARNNFIADQDILILRFDNSLVKAKFEEVCDEIYSRVNGEYNIK